MKSFGLWRLTASESVEVPERELRDVKKHSRLHTNCAFILNYVTVATNCLRYILLLVVSYFSRAHDLIFSITGITIGDPEKRGRPQNGVSVPAGEPEGHAELPAATRGRERPDLPGGEGEEFNSGILYGPCAAH